MHTAYTVHVKWPLGQQSIPVLSPLIVISYSEIQNFYFLNLIAFLFFSYTVTSRQMTGTLGL